MKEVKCAFTLILMLALLNAFLYLFNKIKSHRNRAHYKTASYIKRSIQENDMEIFCRKVAEQLKNSRIVLLGEQQHGDGEAFLIKSKIINVLNKKYGYHTILFEGSYFYNSQLRTKIKTSSAVEEADWIKALYEFWGKSNETSLLRRKMLKSELDFYGFDYNFLVNSYLTDLSKFITSYFLQFQSFDKSDFTELFETLEYKNGPLVLFNYKPRRAQQDICLNQITRLKKFISVKEVEGVADKTMLLTLDNLYQFYYSRTKIREPNRNRHRDSIMFRNVDYLISNLLKKEDKVIIWAANSHLLYRNPGDSYPSMGAYLKDKYRKDLHSVLFTSGSGKTYNIATKKSIQINLTSINSVEYSLNDQHKNYVYGTYLNQKSPATRMKFLGHQNKLFEWQRSTDSFIYIDNMKPTTFYHADN